MFNLMGAVEVGSIVGVVVLIGMLVVYYVLSSRGRKRQQEEAMKMMNELKKGDKIYTGFGVYGEIVSMKETNMGRIAVIKTGDDDGKKVGYMSVDVRAIAGIDMKKDLVLDANGEYIDPENSEELKEEILKENYKPEESVEKNAVEETKKTIKKKTTKSEKTEKED